MWQWGQNSSSAQFLCKWFINPAWKFISSESQRFCPSQHIGFQLHIEFYYRTVLMKFVNYKNGKYVFLKGKQIKESNRLGREEMQKPCPTDKPLIAQTCASVGTFVLTVVKNRLKKGSELELNRYSLAVTKQSTFNRNYALCSILWKYNLKIQKN